ncbi:rCG52066 [Rattus norvegicus]|uniref:RCG52066 n=1 Tax=Rattus norvegicus TaxID=10116 RepID=A6K2Y9_RAT|nr:rCG52066 [Rattus norvegicus]
MKNWKRWTVYSSARSSWQSWRRGCCRRSLRWLMLIGCLMMHLECRESGSRAEQMVPWLREAMAALRKSAQDVQKFMDAVNKRSSS